METWRDGFVDEEAAFIHVVVDGGAGAEIGPDGNHEVDVVFVEGVDQAFGVGIVFVEDGLAHGVPPEPVLDDVVERDAEGRDIFARWREVLAASRSDSCIASSRRPICRRGGRCR